MAPQNGEREVRDDADLRTLEIEADALARFRGLDPERVRKVFHRLVEVNWLAPKFPFCAPLDRAFAFLEPTDALELFEEADLEQLRRRVVLTDFMNSLWTPLYGLDELGELTERLICHLQCNKQHLIQTGWFRSSFERSWFLHTRLNRLYDVKDPLTVQAVRNAEGDFEYTYSWPLQAAQALNFPDLPPGVELQGGGPAIIFAPDGTAHTMDGKPVRGVRYEAAAIMEDLDPTDAERLEKNREGVFSLKIDILGELLRAVRAKDAGKPWDNAFARLSERLLAEEVEFLLRMDSLYTGYDLRTGSEGVSMGRSNNGGLTDLLTVVGHYEEELTVGLYAHTRDALANLIEADELGRPRLPFAYYEAVGTHWQQQLDEGIDVFNSLEKAAEAFWDDHIKRVNDALANELYEEIAVHQKIKRKLAHQFEPHIRSFSEYVKQYMELTGRLPDVDYGRVSVGGATPGCVFRKSDEDWTLVYGGREARLGDRDGLAYIACLLAQPDKSPHVRELYAVAHPPDSLGNDSPYAGMSRKQLEDEGLSLDSRGSPTDKKDDAELFATYRSSRDGLQRDLKDARRRGDSHEADELQTKLDNLNRIMAAEFGLDGSPRKKEDPNKQAYDRVSKAIARAMKAIEEHNRPLFAHLDNAIRYETYTYRYSPERPISWDI